MMNDTVYLSGQRGDLRGVAAGVWPCGSPQSVHPVRVCSAPCEGLREVGPWGLSSS